MADPHPQQTAAPRLTPPPPPPAPPGRQPAVQEPSRQRRGRATRRRSARRRRTLLWSFAVAVVGLALSLAWVGLHALQARAELSQAQRQLPALRAAIVAGDQPAARRQLAALSVETARARRLTADPVWSAYGRLPWAGASLRTGHGLAVAADRLTTDVLPGLISAAATLDPHTLRTAGSGLRLQPFADAEPSLRSAVASSAQILAATRSLPTRGLVGPVAAARTALIGQLAGLAASTRTAADTAALVPSMLGGDGPRTYFLAFENNAEARGTGGLVGAFGVAVADHGTITVTRTGSDADLTQWTKPVLSLGPEYDALYAGFGAETDERETNMSPDFPDAAQIWRVMWQRQSHHAVDGVLALDPVAMAAILDATGPATLPDGSTVSGADVVQLTEQKAYDTFADPTVRKQYLQQVAHAMFGRLVTGAGDARALVTALGGAVGSGHVRLWSAHPQEQALLATLPVSGVLSQAPGPYAQLVVNNAAGGKLDYYLGRRLSYGASPCTGSTRTSTISVTLTNNAPKSGLSAYALSRADKPQHPYPPGQNRSLVSVYAANGAQLLSATLNGKPVTLEASAEKGRPRFSRYVEIDPGADATLVLRLQEPVVAGAATVPVQPLVLPQVTQVSVPTCR